MISESSLARTCSPAILSRARKVAEGGTRLYARACRYDGDKTVLKARVDATYSWDEAYRTSVVIDEGADTLDDYGCDCPASRRFAGPCKHAVALVLDFNERAEEYEGHDATTHRVTSRSVRRLIERSAEQPPAVAGGAEPVVGDVTFELTLSYEAGFDARFRLLGPGGAYVVRSLAEFAAAMEAQAFCAYGKRLAFTHAPEAFDEVGRSVAAFLVRAVQNRRAYAFERVGAGRLGVGKAVAAPARELHLSPPELAELAGIYEGRSIVFEDHTASPQAKAARRVEVRAADPALEVSLAPLGDRSFELTRERALRVVASGGRAYAWDERAFYVCSATLSRRVDLLAGIWGDPTEDLTVAGRDVAAFCTTVLPRLEETLPVAVPPELAALRPAPCRLAFYLDVAQGFVTCKAVARYGEVVLPLVGRGPAQLIAAREAQGRVEDVAAEGNGMPQDAVTGPAVVRDYQAEARGREVVRRYFPISTERDLLCVSASDERAARVAYEGVGELSRIGEVFATPAFDRLRTEARPHVRVGLSVRSNLLDLSLALEGADQSELAGLLESYRLRRRYHRLRDGSFVRMEDVDLGGSGELVEELGVSVRAIEQGRARVPAWRAFMLEGLVDDDARDVSLDEYLDRVRSLDLGSYEVPAALAGVLRPYQVEGFRWMCGLSELGLGGILADEMGLGKSVQLIAYLVATAREARRVGPSLVVCPASLVYNWQAEFAKFAPQLAVVVVAGTVEEREELRRRPADVLVTSYDLLRRDVESFGALRLWCVALDEAQYVKNHATRAARAAKALMAEHRLALTGTPVENRLSELWSIFDFLMPGLLGSYERFRERYERQIVEEEDGAAAERLRAGVRPFVLRRLKRDVLADLPDKIEQVVATHMGPEQRRLYNAQVLALRERLAGQDGAAFGTQKLQVLSALMRLRQICCDPSLVFEDYAGGSCKVDTILTLVERVSDAGEKALVFSQFTSFLDVLAERLDARGIPFYVLTGATSKRRRVELVDEFNADDTPVFLISLKAGGTGLNLTGASVVVHADPWWNAAAQNQATDRAHRIGQTRDVTVYKVIAQDSIEERILELQETKARLAEAVVEGDTSSVSLATLTREDLEDLLG